MKARKKSVRQPASRPKIARYPAPGPVGGKLIRILVAATREAGLKLPLTSHILCACSGGIDSVALAVLLVKYGRRVGAPCGISLLHVNHGWRGKESDGDERFVVSLGRKLRVPVRVRRIREKPKKGESWEAHARTLRKAIYREEAGRTLKKGENEGHVFTGHQADDQAETRLWRLFTGAFATLGEGILPRHGVEVRPLLNVRRTDLIAFLKEEKQSWREDSSNQDPRFLRARMRRELMPVIEAIFPGAIPAINALGAARKSEA